MASLVVEKAFTAEVDLFAEQCAECGFALAMSTQWVGAIADVDDGVPVALVWHLTCAPSALRRAHSA